MIYEHYIDCLCYQETLAFILFPANVSSFSVISACKPIYQNLPGKTVYLYFDPDFSEVIKFHETETQGGITGVDTWLRHYKVEPKSPDDLPLLGQVSVYGVYVNGFMLSPEEKERLLQQAVAEAESKLLSLLVFVNGEKVYER